MIIACEYIITFMLYDTAKFSYGCELEFADVDRFAVLPNGCAFDNKDHTVVNSNGVATDPKARTSVIGGEINVRPTDTIQEQVDVINDIIKSFKIITVNYRCNLHVHVRIPGLRDDLQACKQLAKYIRDHERRVYELIEPIPKPTRAEYTEQEAYDGAMKRFKRRGRSHQYQVSQNVYNKMMSANTTEEFYNAHAPWSEEKKQYCFHLKPRAGINLRPLWETHHNTIEFRHFPGTLDLVEYKSCLTWCEQFLNAALNDPNITPDDILKQNPWMRFPKFQPYQHHLEKTYLLTSYDHCTRKEIEANILKLNL